MLSSCDRLEGMINLFFFFFILIRRDGCNRFCRMMRRDRYMINSVKLV